MDYLLSREIYQAMNLYRVHELWSILEYVCFEATGIFYEEKASTTYELDVEMHYLGF